jgi:lipopolysaccharide transport system permease protein
MLSSLGQHRQSVFQSGRRGFVSDLLELAAFSQALEELIKREIKSRYKRSVLGLGWTMLNPLLMMAVTTLAFSTAFRFSVDRFPLYFLTGYLVWTFFNQATTAACSSLLTSVGLSRAMYLPPALFPLAAVNAAATNLLFSLPLVFLLAVVTGGHFGWPLLFVPVALALVVLFTCGVALCLAAGSVFFHDLIYLQQALFMAWMYLTPIFYPIEIVPEQWSLPFRLNPLYHFIQLFRDPIYGGVWPQPTNLAAGITYALGTAVAGWWCFQRSRDAFASYL